MTRKTFHTVPVGDGWSNKTEGVSRVPKIFDTQSQAIAAGRETAIRRGAEQKIHGADGRIRESNSYGNDPRDTKGWMETPVPLIPGSLPLIQQDRPPAITAGGLSSPPWKLTLG